MLVLLRKPGEVIRIGDDIEIQIIEFRGEGVRVGIRPRESACIAKRCTRRSQPRKVKKTA